MGQIHEHIQAVHPIDHLQSEFRDSCIRPVHASIPHQVPYIICELNAPDTKIVEKIDLIEIMFNWGRVLEVIHQGQTTLFFSLIDVCGTCGLHEDVLVFCDVSFVLGICIDYNLVRL